MPIRNFGSLCSGIEAASYTLLPMGIAPLWLSEIAEYPSRFLAMKYPEHPNVGDMNYIPDMIYNGQIEAPDLLVGGTPCQAFSLAGWRKGVDDERGQLTLKYIDIIDAIDAKHEEKGEGKAVFFWENVEGALTDKTNAFGCFLAGLAGLEEPVKVKRFKSAGVLHGPKRNIAWRVLDAKYFGVPQQRKRVYVLGGGLDFYPENVLFETGHRFQDPYKLKEPQQQIMFDLFGEQEPTVNQESIRQLRRRINGHDIEVFRCYSDCLYASYGTKWNGNAAAFNGSLFVSQDGRLRRLTPVECERLMGFPDNYTAIANPRLTNRYQATGNSWVVPVIKWIMNRLLLLVNGGNNAIQSINLPVPCVVKDDFELFLLDDFTPVGCQYLNASNSCNDFVLSNMLDIIDTDPDEKLYISRAGCEGILRRKHEQNAKMNIRLESVLEDCVTPIVSA